MVRSVMFASGLALLAYWYNFQAPNTPDGKVDPVKPSVVSVEGITLAFDKGVEKFPEAPPEAVQKLLEPLAGLFTQYPNDALEQARATQHFARNVRLNPKIKDLGQLTKAEANAIEGLFKGSVPLQGNYNGQITPVQKAVRAYYLDPIMKDGEGNVTSIAINETSREAVADYLDALSWKFSQEYLKEVSKAKPKEGT